MKNLLLIGSLTLLLSCSTTTKYVNPVKTFTSVEGEWSFNSPGISGSFTIISCPTCVTNNAFTVKQSGNVTIDKYVDNIGRIHNAVTYLIIGGACDGNPITNIVLSKAIGGINIQMKILPSSNLNSFTVYQVDVALDNIPYTRLDNFTIIHN